jgi:hypothetical protein
MKSTSAIDRKVELIILFFFGMPARAISLNVFFEDKFDFF